MNSAALVVALLLTGPVVTFEWAEPEGGIVPDYYEVEYIEERKEPELLTTREPAISLAPTLARAFEIRVRGCTDGVCGSWSELSQAMSLNRSADFTEDGVVGVPDYIRLGQAWGSRDPIADLDGDDVVGVLDYSEFSEHFGQCIGVVDLGGFDVPAYAPCAP
jgi:hypothetical protein